MSTRIAVHRRVWLTLLALVLASLAPMLALAPATVAQLPCEPAPLAATPAPAASDPAGVPDVTISDDAIEVTVGYTPVSIFAPMFIALEKGYFAEAGLDVTLEALPGGADMVVLTATGEFDAGLGGIGPAYWNGVAQGLPVTIIAPGHQEGSPVATPLMISREACESGEITSVADLEGRRVSVNSPGATEIWLDRALRTEGLTIADVDLQYLPFPDAVAALSSGAVDAAMIGEPLATSAEEQEIAVRLATDFDVQGIQPTMIFAGNEFLEQNPEAATGLVTGYLRAARDLTENFNDPVNLGIIEAYTGVPAALVAQSVKPVYATDGVVDLASLTTLQDFFGARDLLEYDDPIDPSSLVDTTFSDAALEDLEGSGS